MRLLHVETLKLTEFLDSNTPEHVILSRRWRHGLNGILYEDVEFSEPWTWRNRKPRAAEKVLRAREVARELEYEYLWIGTCCIDKRSSSELSEAINSMYLWRSKAAVCVAFLDDFDGLDDIGSSKWFTRDWTLQELMAPDNVWSYNRNWRFIDDRFPWLEHCFLPLG
ncbi:putative ankyrin repeat protein [Rosellinia necatrix]|uniref:Putative ankyrin repeat protein n=1 Tax=Rosellinia necatrix TaxID=77044 RepID=A0A1W2TVP1_ROSNE|nr:putative ankyrin repeat protein [Rosellinia necatrix]